MMHVTDQSPDMLGWLHGTNTSMLVQVRECLISICDGNEGTGGGWKHEVQTGGREGEGTRCMCPAVPVSMTLCGKGLLACQLRDASVPRPHAALKCYLELTQQPLDKFP